MTRLTAAKRIGAGVFAVGGLWLAWRTVGPVASRPAPAPASEPPGYTLDLSAPGVVALPDDLSTPVTAQTAPTVAADIISRFRADFSRSSQGRPPDEEGLLNETQAILSIYLAGSFEKYIEHLRATGARSPLLTGGNPELVADVEHMWRHNAAVISEHPVSIDGALIRPRYINGRDMAPPDLGAVASVTNRQRYDIPADPVKSRQTIYEVLIPVFYEWEDRRGPVWWGVWLARSPDSTRWVQVRSVTYDPAAIDAGVVPVF